MTHPENVHNGSLHQVYVGKHGLIWFSPSVKCAIIDQSRLQIGLAVAFLSKGV